MHIGYVYGFPSMPPRNGGTVHVYNLVRQLRRLGCTIHTIGDETNPSCVTYPATTEGYRAFMNAIDLLYLRVDGTAVSRHVIKRRCTELSHAKPTVWEINAPAEERLWALRTGAPVRDAKRRPLRLVREPLRSLRLRWRVFQEEHWRRSQARGVAAAICVSGQMAVYARRDLHIRTCAVIPNGSDPELFAVAEPIALGGYEQHIKVLYAGDFRWPWQEFDLIDQIAALAQRDGRRMVFIVLSHTPIQRVYTRENILIFTGVPYLDVPRYVAAADVCLCLYGDFSWSRYGFYPSSLKLFDYMAAGKPVIASRQGQLAEVIEGGKDGLLTDHNSNNVYRNLLWCIEHPEAARQLGKRAQAKALRAYTWGHAAQSTLDVLRAVVAGYSRTPPNPSGRSAVMALSGD